MLYLDTSALVKLYVREVDSDVVRALVRAATHVATSRIAYVEARAAFARRARERALSTRGLRQVVEVLERDLGAWVMVEASDEVVRLAGELAERHALRGYDALHLASASALATWLSDAVVFLAYDARLMAAATAEGLSRPEP
ncbi:MAG: type II toxin-antitoxin system VapC family toxin [Deltaproteobacteria bacterium]|nr:type II toxin-antitoxin system VapC family toxin [Deltaproteobacteria bacterium]